MHPYNLATKLVIIRPASQMACTFIENLVSYFCKAPRCMSRIKGPRDTRNASNVFEFTFNIQKLPIIWKFYLAI